MYIFHYVSFETWGMHPSFVQSGTNNSNESGHCRTLQLHISPEFSYVRRIMTVKHIFMCSLMAEHERKPRWVPLHPVFAPPVNARLNASAPPADTESDDDDDSDYIDAGSTFQQPLPQQQQQHGQDVFSKLL